MVVALSPDEHAMDCINLGLDNRQPRSTIPGNSPRICPFAWQRWALSGFMNPKPPAPPATPKPPAPCKHLRVQIVSRDEDAEFVECKECGEIFESSEFRDMNIEEQTREEL